MDITTDEDGNPTNLMDWITYKWCQKHRHVADKEATMTSDHRFYIYDPNRSQLDKNNEIKIKKEADKEFIKVSNDVDKMRRILRVFGTARPEKLSQLEVENTLFDIKEKQSAKFLKIAIDKNLDMRAEIEEMKLEQESFARLVTSISMRKQSERTISPTPSFILRTKKNSAGQCHESTTL